MQTWKEEIMKTVDIKPGVHYYTRNYGKVFLSEELLGQRFDIWDSGKAGRSAKGKHLAFDRHVTRARYRRDPDGAYTIHEGLRVHIGDCVELQTVYLLPQEIIEEWDAYMAEQYRKLAVVAEQALARRLAREKDEAYYNDVYLPAVVLADSILVMAGAAPFSQTVTSRLDTTSRVALSTLQFIIGQAKS